MGKLYKGPWSLTNNEPNKFSPPGEDLEYVAFDVETTGFNKNDRIVEIGLVTFKNDLVLEEWSTLLNPQRDVGKSNIHGITASMVSTAPLFEEVVNDIFRIISGRVLVAHQFSFDARMLAQELNRLDVNGDLGKGFCTLIASRNLLPGTADSLAATCEALGIETIDAHSAVGDARMTMQIFQKLSEDGQEVIQANVN
jgi:DNA polymerase-3 subunit epsilon